jgi:hypothetical protein
MVLAGGGARWLRNALKNQGGSNALTEEEKPLLLIAILSARGGSHFRRRQLIRQSVATQSRPTLDGSPFLLEAGVAAAVKIVFVVGSGCDVPVRNRLQQSRCPDTRPLTEEQWKAWEASPHMSRNDVICKHPANEAQAQLGEYPAQHSCWHVDWSQRCGAHYCVADPAKGTTERINLMRDDTDELALEKEQEQHGDIFRVQAVDEYSRSAEKMRLFILQIGGHGGAGEGSVPAHHLLKLDDDNVIDLARVLCTLSATLQRSQAALKSPCAAAGLDLDDLTGMFSLTPTLAEFEEQLPDGTKRLNRRRGPKMKGRWPPDFWWSAMRAGHEIHLDPEGGYYVPKAVANAIAANMMCYGALAAVGIHLYLLGR